MRKFAKILLVLIVVMGLLFYVGGGWYFSSVFKSDALETDPWPQYFETEVVSFDGAVITLKAGAHPDEELMDPGVFGLEWSDGYGQLGPFVENDGTLVTREYAPVSGANPAPGTLADAEATAFPSDPAVLGRTWQTVEYQSELGPMEAWQVEGDGSTWTGVTVTGSALPQ